MSDREILLLFLATSRRYRTSNRFLIRLPRIYVNGVSFARLAERRLTAPRLPRSLGCTQGSPDTRVIHGPKVQTVRVRKRLISSMPHDPFSL